MFQELLVVRWDQTGLKHFFRVTGAQRHPEILFYIFADNATKV